MKPVLTPNEVDELRGDDPTLRLIDVRSGGEFGIAHIPGSLNVPLATLAEHRARWSEVRRPLVLVCQTGGRAARAEEALARTGLEHVSVMAGGINAWAEAGLPLDRGEEKWALERQVRLVAGSMVAGGVLASTRWPRAKWLSGAVGAGLTFAAVSNTCALGALLSRLPYNRSDSCDIDVILGQLVGMPESGGVTLDTSGGGDKMYVQRAS